MAIPRELKERISDVYAKKIQASSPCCGTEDACGGNYPLDVVQDIPDGVVSFGCGNPTSMASLRPGETVLDLGSGAGLDCFLAARAVGPGGEVIGVDFTPAMIERARENAAKLGLANVSFHQGDIEALPLEDAAVDIVISNCVINLAPDKDAVFREAFRVLRRGGRLMVSDIVLTRPATDQEAEDMDLMSGCISGSLVAEDYIAKVRGAGFENVQLDGEHPAEEGRFWFASTISASKL